MAVISFQFSPEADRREQDRTLATLREIPGIRTVDPEADDPEISRMCLTEMADDPGLHSVDSVRTVPATLKGVQSIDEEPRRELVW